jgi:uncharacterized membrane protein
MAKTSLGSPAADRVVRVNDARNDLLAKAGYAGAIIFPLIGIVIGVVLFNRSDRRATPVLIISVLVSLIWLIFLSSIQID